MRTKKKEDRFKPIDKYDMFAIGKQEGLNEKESFKFMEFMQRRFPKENDTNYAHEWARRFKQGNPEEYMDRQSKKAYSEVQ